MVLTLDGDDIVEVDVQDREHVHSEKRLKCQRKKMEIKREQITHVQLYDIMDDMQIEWMRTKDTLSHNVVQTHVQGAWENHVWDVSVYTPSRVQWITIDCKRNQL